MDSGFNLFFIFFEKQPAFSKTILRQRIVLVFEKQNIFYHINNSVELSLNYQNTLGKIQYHIGDNISYTNNKVVSLNGQQQICFGLK